MLLHLYSCGKNLLVPRETDKNDWGFWKKKQQTSLVIGKYDNPLLFAFKQFPRIFLPEGQAYIKVVFLH